MKQTHIKIGLIGAGRFGKFHLRNLLESPFELIGFFDNDPSVAERVSREFGVQSFGSVDELMDEVDAVDIVVPTSLHMDFARRAIARGKHMFIEKPIADSAEEISDFVKEVTERGLMLQVGHIERYNPAFKAALSALKDPFFISSKRLAPYNPRANDVSVVHDLMIHDIDAVLSLVDSKVDKLYATGRSVLTNHLDICEARMIFENGCMANLMASRMHPGQQRFTEVYCDRNFGQIDFQQKTFKLVTLDNYTEDNAMGYEPIKTPKGDFIQPEKMEKFPNNNAILEELNEFYNSIVNDEPTRVDQNDAFRALFVADKIQQISIDQL